MTRAIQDAIDLTRVPVKAKCPTLGQVIVVALADSVVGANSRQAGTCEICQHQGPDEIDIQHVDVSESPDRHSVLLPVLAPNFSTKAQSSESPRYSTRNS